jgi:hypothetical protein
VGDPGGRGYGAGPGSLMVAVAFAAAAWWAARKGARAVDTRTGRAAVGRWVRVLLGPLPATILLLPLLFAGGLGTAIGVLAVLLEPGHSAAERWSTVPARG